MAYNIYEQMAKQLEQRDKPVDEPNIYEQMALQQKQAEQPADKLNVYEQMALGEAGGQELPQESQLIEGTIPQTVIPKPGGPFFEPEEAERLTGAFTRGAERSFIAKIAGTKPEGAPKDENWLEHLASTSGELLGDYPLILAGFKLGAMAGSPGGLIGAATAGTIGAFTLPAVMKSALAEYQDWVEEGNDASFGDFIERSARVAKEGGKSAILGAAVGTVAKFLPFLKKIPGMKKILNTNWGRTATAGALETGGLTLGEAAVNMEAPTWKKLRDNALMIGTMQVTHKMAAKIPVRKTAAKLAKPISDISVALVPPALRAKAAKLIPEPVKAFGRRVAVATKGVGQFAKAVGIKDLNAKEKVYFEWLENHVGKKDARIMKSQFKWNKEVAITQQELGRELTKQELSEAKYYRQRTHNPNIKGDTFEALKERISEPVKKLVDVTIDRHFKETKKQLNDNPLMRDINARQTVEDTYLHALYKHDAKKFAHASKSLSKQFKKGNTFANMKEFINFAEAAEKAGLEPLYDNIIDGVRMYDKKVIELEQNAKLMHDIRTNEKENKTKLIINPKNEQQLSEAKELGFVPFEDRYLRRYIRGKKADGTPEWATSEFPAMLDPDLAEAFQGIFKRKLSDSPNPLAEMYDAATQIQRYKNVALSFYHYGPLTESAVASPLGLKFFRPLKWLSEGGKLHTNEKYMTRVARAGLDVKGPVDVESYKTAERGLDKLYELTKKYGSVAKIPVKTMQKFNNAFGFLFTTFHPRLKLVTFNAYANEIVGKLTKAGEVITPKRMLEIDRGVAKLVNNILGGQKWEIMPFFNNPRNVKWIRRIMAYPNWNVSSWRQFMMAFKTPEYLAKLERTSAGKRAMISIGKKYWLRYGAYMFATTGLLKFLSSGVEQTDPDDSIAGLRFNINKAWNGVINGDPTKTWMFPLPDVNVRIPGTDIRFNPGRDLKGIRIYGHGGKQMRENFGWMTHPMVTAWNKLNPLIQIVTKQVFGMTPTKDGWWKVRGKYKGNEKVSWDAAKPYSPEWFMSHAKEFITDVTQPYSVGTLRSKGVAPWLITAMGAIPLSKGMNEYTAAPLIRKALLKKDVKSLNNIVKFLRENKIANSKIKRLITTIKNQLKRERR